MSDTIIVALISAGGVLISSLISVAVSSALINWRLKELEKKVDVHNGYAKKFGETATAIALLQQDLKYIKEKL